jgi:tetratricopeptide (TPR) repeat protein
VRQAATIEPGHTGARLSLARCRMQQHRLAEALAIVEPVVASAPGNFAAQRLHAELLLSLERYAEAISAYNRALRLNPEDATSFYGASVAQLALGEPHASRTFDAVLRLDPNPEWHRARMYAAWRVGQTDAVIHEGRQYLRKEGWVADASIYVALGVALEHLRRGETREAALLLAEAGRHADSKTWVAHLVRYLQGRTTDAELLKRARSIELLTVAYAYVGVKASIEGRTDEAVRRLQWVEAKGDPSLVEYQIAIRELKRLGMPEIPRPRVTSPDEATDASDESTPLREAYPSYHETTSSF